MTRPVDILFPREAANKAAGRCAFDKTGTHDTTTFRDDLSRREFAISHLCQACQDDVFGGDDE